jgi:hypothetical protein
VAHFNVLRATDNCGNLQDQKHCQNGILLIPRTGQIANETELEVCNKCGSIVTLLGPDSVSDWVLFQGSLNTIMSFPFPLRQLNILGPKRGLRYMLLLMLLFYFLLPP